MSNLKISQLTGATTPLAGTETLPVVQSGSTVKVSVANLTAGRAVATAGGSFTDNITQSTVAKGINFTANTPAAGMTSQLLNWYEEGTFTPTITAGTAGNLSVSYSTQLGRYTRIGNRVYISASIVTSAFSYTTASGLVRLGGLPFSSNGTSGNLPSFSLFFTGLTKLGYTQFVPYTDPGNTWLIVTACASGVSNSGVNITDFPTGGTVGMIYSGHYQI
jgi:hypothetical protein